MRVEGAHTGVDLLHYLTKISTTEQQAMSSCTKDRSEISHLTKYLDNGAAHELMHKG